MFQAAKAVECGYFWVGEILGEKAQNLVWITYLRENGEGKSPKFRSQSSERHPRKIKAIGFWLNSGKKERRATPRSNQCLRE